MRTSLESVCRKRCKKGSGPNPGVEKSAKENREEWPKDCGQDGHDSIRKESKDAEKSPRGRQRSARRTRPAGGCWRQALGLMNSEAGWRWLTGGGEVGSRELRVWMTPKALTVKGGRGIGWWLEGCGLTGAHSYAAVNKQERGTLMQEKGMLEQRPRKGEKGCTLKHWERGWPLAPLGTPVRQGSLRWVLMLVGLGSGWRTGK